MSNRATAAGLTKKQMIAEHHRRRETLKDNYNPYTGEGSPIERFPCTVVPGATIYLPLEMKSDAFFQHVSRLGWKKAAHHLFSDENPEEEKQLEALQLAFHTIRCRYDYEYWAATCWKIEDAETNEVIPMILNAPQRISMADRERMRAAGEPVRQIEGKHRQYGSSTEKNAYIFWIQNVVTQGVNAYLCSIDKPGALEILRRYESGCKHYPAEMGSYRLKSYKGQQNTQVIVGSNSIVNIGSAEKPNAPSGRTVQCVLISEAGKMKSTAEKGANKLITNMVSMVRMVANTFVLIESTAEKSGGWFRSQILKAKRGESGFKLTFINWVSDPRCQVMLADNELEPFIESLSTYERDVLWAHGASLDQINWYRKKEKEYDQPWEMKQEHPTTVEEMFASSGKKVFSPGMIIVARSTIREPKFIGEIHGKASQGPDSLKDLRFEEDPNGSLKIWMHPDEFVTPNPVAHRASCYVDIGGTTKKSDWSVIKVVDRWPMIEGGAAECAAEWRGHIDPELLAWKSAQVAMYFYEALLAVEVNALYSRGNNTDGVHYLTIFNEIGNHYRNLFTRERSDKIKDRPNMYGYHMTEASKDILVSGLKSSWRPGSGGGYIERNELTAQEAAFFEIKDDGRMGAIEGEHDDSLIASAGAKWLATDYMPAPFYIEKSEIKQRMAHEADF